MTLRVTNALPTGAECTSAIAKCSHRLLDLNELKDAEQGWNGTPQGEYEHGMFKVVRRGSGNRKEGKEPLRSGMCLRSL